MAFRESFEKTRPLAANGEFSLENTNGRVVVTTWDEPKVRIEATKAAPSERALRDLEIEVEGEGDRVEVRSRYSRPRWLGGAAKVDYRVTVPREARVKVRNVNGRVEVRGVNGRLEASSVNGSVELSDLGGEVEATTVNGSLEVRMAKFDPADRNRLSTTNGSVRLTLPGDAAADLEARTVNGRVHCDFDLSGDGRVSRRRVEGRIGAGGARFELRTVNGSAHIDRGLSASARTPAEAGPSADRARR
jgi:hypothetical protein